MEHQGNQHGEPSNPRLSCCITKAYGEVAKVANLFRNMAPMTTQEVI